MVGFEASAVGEFCLGGGAAVDEVVVGRSKGGMGFDDEEGNNEEEEMKAVTFPHCFRRGVDGRGGDGGGDNVRFGMKLNKLFKICLKIVMFFFLFVSLDARKWYNVL